MYIHVKVYPNAKKELWVLKKPAHFEASIREKAEHNQANIRILRLAADYFGVPVSRVHVVNGHHSPSKLIWVEEK